MGMNGIFGMGIDMIFYSTADFVDVSRKVFETDALGTVSEITGAETSHTVMGCYYKNISKLNNGVSRTTYGFKDDMEDFYLMRFSADVHESDILDGVWKVDKINVYNNLYRIVHVVEV